ncbi:MAG TPA: cytochrome P450 [Alphaproteobacteria bacterium]|nr:cytochrome P450 [Alphaproteobacteria bacterium]
MAGGARQELGAAELRRPQLAEPPHLGRRGVTLRRVWRLHKNALAAWSEDAYREDMIESRMLFRRILVANCPAAAKHVLLDNASNYVKSFIARQLLRPLGKGLLSSEGDEWRRQRRTMAPSFHPRRLAAFSPVIVQASLEAMKAWQLIPRDAIVDIHDAMAKLTLDIITRTMFSSDIRDRADEVRAALLQYQRVGGRPAISDLLGLPRWLPRRNAGRVRQAGMALDEIIYGLIDRRRTEGGPKDDLLGLLLAARDEETGEVMDDRELRDQLATIFTAGHETTANALTWTWYLLSAHPEIEAKLHSELTAVLGARPPENDDIAQLRYTRMVIEESMRLYPPAHTISREALADDEILGHEVPKGSAVLISPWLLHRHEKLWDMPKIFNPERFAPERAGERPRYSYIPFGGGPRVCIGAGFAMQEAILIIATVAQHFAPHVVPGVPVEPLGLITLKPKGGLPVTLVSR